MYSATAKEDYTPTRITPQKWEKVKPYFGKPYWKWVGKGPADPCGSWSTFEVDDYDHGQQSGTKRVDVFEGPPCQNGGAKKRKQPKKTHKGSRR